MNLGNVKNINFRSVNDYIDEIVNDQIKIILVSIIESVCLKESEYFSIRTKLIDLIDISLYSNLTDINYTMDVLTEIFCKSNITNPDCGYLSVLDVNIHVKLSKLSNSSSNYLRLSMLFEIIRNIVTDIMNGEI